MKEINQFISGTFLEGLLNELAKINEKDFIEPDGEIKPDETVIDEMNRLEKAVLTWFTLKIRNIPKCTEEIIDEIYKNCKDSITNLSTVSSRLILEKNKIELMSKMLWLSIRQRGKNLEYSSLGIRKGFKIVSCPAFVEDERDKPGITGIVISSSLGSIESLNTLLSDLLKGKGEGPISGSKKRFEF